MKAKIIRIGNSKGIRIPKAILAQCDFDEDVELDVRNGELVIHSSTQIRRGWNAHFSKMAEQGDDQLLDAENNTDWDQDEWEWQ